MTIFKAAAAVLVVSVTTFGLGACGGDDDDDGGGTGGVGGKATGGATGTTGGSSGTTGGSSGTTGGSSATGGATSGTGGNTGSATSGVTGSKRIDALTATEKAQLCDWTAAKFGGYGKPSTCSNGLSLEPGNSQADCVAKSPPNCAATVSQYEMCIATRCDSIPIACAPLASCQ